MRDFHILSIATEFSRTPGPRLRSEGKHSGEEFRQFILRRLYEVVTESHSKLIIVLDGTYGYGTGFLEEAFGGLIRNDGVTLDDFRERVEFASYEEPYLVDEIWGYMEDASG